MRIIRLILAVICFSPLVAFSQRSYSCEAVFLQFSGPTWMPYFNEDTLKKRNVTQITVHAGPLIQKDQLSQYKKEYRIQRFLVNRGRLIESVNFSRKDIFDGKIVGIPEEYQKYVYSGDTLVTMYHTWALMHYEERYAMFLSDYSIDDYLQEINLEYASVSDIYMNKAGDPTYLIRRGENGEVLPELETTYYYYNYDEKGEFLSAYGQQNLNPFGIDSVDVISNRVVADKKTGELSEYQTRNGKEVLIQTVRRDDKNRTLANQRYDEHGMLRIAILNTYNSEGLLIRTETHNTPDTKTKEEDECSDILEEVVEFEYHPDGLLHYANVRTNKGTCGLLFTYK